jgi:hypothetical protein
VIRELRYFASLLVCAGLTAAVAPAFGADNERKIDAAIGRLTGQFVLAPGVQRKLPVTRKRSSSAVGDAIEVVDETVTVSPQREVAGVLIYAVGDGIPHTPVPSEPILDFEVERPVPVRFVSLRAEAWRFDPHILPFRTSDSLLFINGAPAPTSTRIEPPGEKGINPLLPSGVALHYRFTTSQPLPIRVSNDIVPEMHAYILPLDHPFFAVSRQDGTFTIDGLPGGREIEFQLWHENWGPIVTKRTPGGRLRIRIRPGENNLGNFEFEP